MFTGPALHLHYKGITRHDTCRGRLYNWDRRREKLTVTHCAIMTKEAAMFYPDLAKEIDQLIQELDEKIEALRALKIDQEEDMKGWDTRVELINRVRLFKQDLTRIKESFQ